MRFDRADLSTLPLPDGAADIIVASCALGSTANPLVLLSEIARILSPHGTAVLVEDVPEGGRTKARKATVLPTLQRPGRNEDFLRTAVKRCSLREAAQMTRYPAGNDSFLEIHLSHGGPPPARRGGSSWHLT